MFKSRHIVHRRGWFDGDEQPVKNPKSSGQEPACDKKSTIWSNKHQILKKSDPNPHTPEINILVQNLVLITTITLLSPHSRLHLHPYDDHDVKPAGLQHCRDVEQEILTFLKIFASK